MLALAGLMAFFILPLAVLALYGLSSVWIFPQLLPRRFDTRALEFAWSQRAGIATALAFSTLYSLATAAATLLICLAPARLLARRDFRFKTVIEGLLLAPALVPSMTFSMGVHFVFIKLGLSDTFAGVVMVLTIFTYPYMLRALVSGFLTFSPDYAACAANLGASPLRTALTVELPLLTPAVIAGGGVVFLIAFSEYFLVFLIGGGSVPSFAGYLFPYLGSSNRALASLLTLLFLAVPLVMFAVTEALTARLTARLNRG